MRLPCKLLSSAVLLSLTLLLSSCVLPGSIDRGRKFGVQVGMPAAEAIAILERRGLRRVPGTENWLNADCGCRRREQGEVLEMFAEDDSERVICILTASDRVVAIAWDSPFF
jgi:hypothetical protein